MQKSIQRYKRNLGFKVTMEVLPQFLQKGDKVAIISPSGIVNREPIMAAVTILENWGLKVVLGRSVFNVNGIFAGTDAERINDFNTMIHDDSIKAVFCSRGGYGAARILPFIDTNYLIKNPKWIIGFSDVTVMHAGFNNLSLCTIHGVMPNSFAKTHTHSLQSLREALFGKQLVYSLPHHQLNQYGNVTGKLVGGNLSILYSLRGTPFELSIDETILFIEDVGEKLYHLDRMMVNFHLSNIFTRIKGLIVGGFSDMTEGTTPYGKTAYEIIKEYVKDYDIPVVFDFKAGHIFENNALILGKTVTLNCQKSQSSLIL